MTRMLYRSAAMATMAVLTTAAGMADTLYLRAGEQEPGRLVAITKNEVRFEGTGGVRTWRKADVLKIQLQRARTFDDVQTAAAIADPDLRACLDGQPGPADFPSAASVTLLYRHTYDLTQPAVLTNTVRRITKVMQQRGEEAATASVFYFEDTDAPNIDYALTVTEDGRVLHLSDDAIKNESLFASFPDYRRLARFRFACKEPRPGSVFDVQHTVARKRGDPLEPFYADVVFRAEQPILRQEVVVLVREGDESRVASELSGPAVVASKREVADGVVRLTWTLSQPQQGVIPEPLMPPVEAFAPRLTLGESASWEEVGQGYGGALTALPALPAELIEKAIALDAEGGPRAIHDFIARTVRTAPVPHGAYRPLPHAAGDTYQRGVANELDKNYLYYKMLEAANVPCSFALVRGRDRGPLPEGVAALRGFDRSAVYVKAGGRYEVTESDVLPFGAMPDGMYEAPALSVDAKGSMLTATQAARPEDELAAAQFDATLDEAGNLALRLTYSGSANMGAWMRSLKNMDAEKLRNTMQQIANRVHPAAKLIDYTTSDLAALDTPALVTLQCTIPGYAVRAGDDLMLFTLPALAYDASEVGRPVRGQDLFWDHVVCEEKQGTIRIPSGYRVYSIPDKAHFDSPVAAYDASVSVEDGTVRFSDQYALRVQDAPADAYGEYKACKELRAGIPRQRVILTR